MSCAPQPGIQRRGKYIGPKYYQARNFVPPPTTHQPVDTLLNTRLWGDLKIFWQSDVVPCNQSEFRSLVHSLVRCDSLGCLLCKWMEWHPLMPERDASSSVPLAGQDLPICPCSFYPTTFKKDQVDRKRKK